jgi:hypothetical protein
MVRDMCSFLSEYSSSMVLALHAIKCTSRVVLGAHRVVGPGTHRSSGPRDAHTTLTFLIFCVKESSDKGIECKTYSAVIASKAKTTNFRCFGPD